MDRMWLLRSQVRISCGPHAGEEFNFITHFIILLFLMVVFLLDGLISCLVNNDCKTTVHIKNVARNDIIIIKKLFIISFQRIKMRHTCLKIHFLLIYLCK